MIGESTRRPPRWVTNALALLAIGAAATAVVAKNLSGQDPSRQFLNVSYDPTRELYRDIDRLFSAEYTQSTGQSLTVAQSHGGSSRQARAVIDGVPADVVTLAMHSDVVALQRHGLIADGWEARLPNGSRPYTSTIVFVVRRGNPRQIREWRDLIRPGVAIVTPDPRTSGNGKLSFLAAWGSVLHGGGDEAQARAFVAELYRHAGTLAEGARGAATAFADEKLGDVHLTWENEALREVDDAKGDLEIVYPRSSILAEPYVAWVDTNVARKGTAAVAKAYLEFLFTPAAQAIIAAHGYRPIDPRALAAHPDRFPPLDLFPVTLLANDWEEAQQKFFGDGGVYERLALPGSALAVERAAR
jgi:sulfate/thiosulfate transport system substrate-binding protein